MRSSQLSYGSAREIIAENTEKLHPLTDVGYVIIEDMKRQGNSEFFARTKRVFVVSVCMVAAFLLCFHTTVAALTDEMLDKFAANNIMFYDPDDKGNTCVGEPVSGSSISYIGDSISDGGAYTKLKSAYAGLDGEDKEYDGTTYDLVQVSKHFATDVSGNFGGVTIATKMVEKGDMRPYLIFALGTNDQGSVSTQRLEALASAVGDKTKVMLVTNYGLHTNSYETNNENMKSFAASHSNFSVADWYTTAISDPTRYINDGDGLGVHLTSEGTAAFVDVIKNAISSNWVAGSSGGSSGDNTNYAGNQILTDEQLAMVKENQPFYEAAAQPYGFPWQLLAAIHYREHNLSRTNPTENSQGIYQLYSLWVSGQINYTPGEYQDDEAFAEQTNLAAAFLNGKIQNSSYDHYSDEGVKQALFYYNGAASQYKHKAIAMGFTEEQANYGEGSPYVMNFYDARRDHTSGQVDPNWGGRFTADGVYTPGANYDSRPGGFLVYQAIGGGGAQACSNVDVGGIIGTVMKYAWPQIGDHRADKELAKQEYVDRLNEGGFYKGSSGANHGQPGIDCGAWVSFVMIESGYEPGYNPGHGNVDAQIRWVQANPNWELINQDWNTPVNESDLQPGDVAYTCSGPESNPSCGHTYVYIGEVEGFETHIASASQYHRAPGAGTEEIQTSSGRAVKWYRRVR